MSFVEQWLMEYEVEEKYQDMHWSLYAIPYSWKEQE